MRETIINGTAGILPDALAQLPDEALLGMMTQHNEQALGALYDRYGRLVYSLALHITDNLVTAERVTEAVFEHVWTAADAIRAAYAPGHGWIIAITRQHTAGERRPHR